MSCFRSVVVLWLALGIAGCDLLGIGPDRRTLIVLDHMVECSGVGLQLCMIARGPGDPEVFRIYGGIEGFVYEWGYVQTIRVEDQRVANPPADGSSIRRVLRRTLSKERVPAGTEFDIFLTGGAYSLLEVEPGTYRAYGSVDLTCSGDARCAGLSSAVAAGSRIGFRLRHPASPGSPLEVVAWEVCDGQLLGASTCTP